MLLWLFHLAQQGTWTNVLEKDGEFPTDTDFTDEDGTDCTTTVEEHKIDTNGLKLHKVMQLDDDDASSNASFYITMETRTSGTLEFFICVEDATSTFRIMLEGTGGGQGDGLWLFIKDDVFQFYDSSFHNIKSNGGGMANVAASNNTWYRVKIIYDTTDWQLYIAEGLGAYTQYGWDDSGYTENFTFVSAPNDFKNVWFITGNSGDTADITDAWITGIGDSEDTDYTVGDNVNIIDQEVLEVYDLEVERNLNLPGYARCKLPHQVDEDKWWQNLIFRDVKVTNDADTTILFVGRINKLEMFKDYIDIECRDYLIEFTDNDLEFENNFTFDQQTITNVNGTVITCAEGNWGTNEFANKGCVINKKSVYGRRREEVSNVEGTDSAGTSQTPNPKYVIGDLYSIRRGEIWRISYGEIERIHYCAQVSFITKITSPVKLVLEYCCFTVSYPDDYYKLDKQFEGTLQVYNTNTTLWEDLATVHFNDTAVYTIQIGEGSESDYIINSTLTVRLRGGYTRYKDSWDNLYYDTALFWQWAELLVYIDDVEPSDTVYPIASNTSTTITSTSNFEDGNVLTDDDVVIIERIDKIIQTLGPNAPKLYDVFIKQSSNYTGTDAVGLNSLDVFNIIANIDNVFFWQDNTGRFIYSDPDQYNSIYPGTYTFTGETAGANPAGWTVAEDANTDVKINALVDGHADIMELYDNNGAGKCQATQTFSAQNFGTVELWVRSNDFDKDFTLELLDASDNVVITFYAINGTGYYKDGAVQTEWGAGASDTWFHVKIDFERTTNGYEGLAQNTWQLEVRTTTAEDPRGPFDLTSNADIAKLTFYTSDDDSGYSYYIDAVGYSWDPLYVVGSNFKLLDEPPAFTDSNIIDSKLIADSAELWNQVRVIGRDGIIGQIQTDTDSYNLYRKIRRKILKDSNALTVADCNQNALQLLTKFKNLQTTLVVTTSETPYDWLGKIGTFTTETLNAEEYLIEGVKHRQMEGKTSTITSELRLGKYPTNLSNSDQLALKIDGINKRLKSNDFKEVDRKVESIDLGNRESNVPHGWYRYVNGSGDGYSVSGLEFTVNRDSEIYHKGKKVFGNQDTVTLTASSLNLVYYDRNGNLQFTTDSLTKDIFRNNVFMWFVLTNATDCIAEYWEHHGITMPRDTHYHLHETQRLVWVSGLGITWVEDDGADDEDAQITLGVGHVHDEDIVIEVTDGAGTGKFEQPLSVLEAPIYYRTGATGTWEILAASTFIVYPADGNRSQWNELTGGAWQLTTTADGKFLAMWVFASNEYNEPIILIMGQETDLIKTAAIEGNQLSALSLGNLPAEELKPLYRLIIQTKDTYANTVKAKIVDVQDLRESTVFSSGVPAVFSHLSLGDLNGSLYLMGGHSNTVRRVVSAATDPVVTDDLDTYPEGTIWLNQTDDTIFICLDNTDGAAVWKQVIPDDTAYNEGTWNANNDPATKNAIRDVMETKLAEVSEDTTPQLGGDLDLNGNNIDFPTTANISDCKDEDDMASDSATMLATQQSIKAYVDNYTVLQHDRPIPPNRSLPEQFDVAGVNNVYWDATRASIKFGHSSLDNGNYARVNFILPPDYISGEDITFRAYMFSEKAGVMNLTFDVYFYYATPGANVALANRDQNNDRTLLGSSELDIEDWTGTGTNITAGDLVHMILYFQDDDDADITVMYASELIVPVNTRI